MTVAPKKDERNCPCRIPSTPPKCVTGKKEVRQQILAGVDVVLLCQGAIMTDLDFDFSPDNNYGGTPTPQLDSNTTIICEGSVVPGEEGCNRDMFAYYLRIGLLTDIHIGACGLAWNGSGRLYCIDNR
jgi:hypothetical protein